MAMGKNQLLEAFANLTRRRLLGMGIELDNNLERLLKNMREGDEKTLGQLPEALVNAGRTHLYAPDFFSRDPVTVAEELCGSSLSYANDVMNSWSGLVTETGAYRTYSKKDEAVAKAEPGTIGLYPAQGHQILIISAHEPGKKGTVAVWGLGVGEYLSMARVTQLMTAEKYTGKIIGVDAPFYLSPRNTSNKKIGNLEVNSMGNCKSANARYCLRKI